MHAPHDFPLLATFFHWLNVNWRCPKHEKCLETHLFHFKATQIQFGPLPIYAPLKCPFVHSFHISFITHLKCSLYLIL